MPVEVEAKEEAATNARNSREKVDNKIKIKLCKMIITKISLKNAIKKEKNFNQEPKAKDQFSKTKTANLMLKSTRKVEAEAKPPNFLVALAQSKMPWEELRRSKK